MHNSHEHSPDRPPVPPMSRRGLLRLAGGAAATVAGAALAPPGIAEAALRSSGSVGASTLAMAAASTFSPLRPPATPLAVRSPYLTTWLPGDTLPGTWPTFWNSHITALCGIARIDGTPYVFAGSPALPNGPALSMMSQMSLQITATRSIYTLTGGGVTLTVTFFSPVDPNNVQRQSVPLSYVTMQVASNDGRNHSVDLHLDASGEWVHGDVTQQITWSHQQTGRMTILTCAPANPGILQEFNDQASWGTLVLAAPNQGGLTWQNGQDTVVRAASAGQGTLNNTSDGAQPRAINDRWPVFGLNQNLGTVTPGSPSSLFRVTVGHVRTPALSYVNTPQLNPWWTHYWGSWTDMVDWFDADYGSALAAATALDQRVHDDAARAAGGGTTGEHYAATCALALRQAIGGAELVDRGGVPWAFQKEISSSGNVSTVDVIYPTYPVYLYLSPTYLRMLLEPLLYLAESGGWNQPFAEHDTGLHYPIGDGHLTGQEDMPVEESANMLIMAAAVIQRINSGDAGAFASAHYAILRKWAEYLVANALDPGYQNQTDDFTGFIAHSVNLALKGIIGIGAMSVIAAAAGNSGDVMHYRSVARSYISQWVSLGEDSSNQNMKIAYDRPGTWSLKYNGFSDRVLGLDLVPVGIAAQEAAWYQSHAGAYGVILDPRNNYTKADWELWTAAWLTDQPNIRNTLIEGVYNFVNNTPQRVPFSDWYVVADATQRGFADRPVVGGAFSLVVTPAGSTTSWRRIQNQHSGKLLAVSNMSLADSAEVTQWSDNGTPDHVWTLVDNGDSTVRIMNRNSGKVLAVHNQDLTDGAHVQQYKDNGTPDHLWRFVDAGGGWSKIVNVHSGKVIAVDQQSLADGAQITQWTDNGSPDHLWRLI